MALQANPDWSDEAVQRTRQIISEAPMELGQFSLKHADGRYGLVDDHFSANTPIRVQDRQSGAVIDFDDVDALIADGWVVD